MAIESFRQEIDRLRNEHGRRYGAIKKALASSPAIIVSQGRHEQLLIKSGETRPGGLPWRVTTFMPDGPWGHQEYKDDAEIFEDLARSHFDSVRPASEAEVMAWTSTPAYQRGAAAAACMQAEHEIRYRARNDASIDRTLDRARELAEPGTTEALEAAAAHLQAAVRALPRQNPARMTAQAARGFGRAAARQAMNVAPGAEYDAEPFFVSDVQRYPELEPFADHYYRAFWDEVIAVEYPDDHAQLTDGGYMPNPAWVTSAIAGAYETLTERVPPKWLPRLSHAKQRHGTFLARLKEYGCGAYGCVLPTLDDRTVLKVTTDTTEAEFARDLAATLVVPITVDYRLVAQLGTLYKRRQIYLLWRESAEDVGKLDDHPLISAQHRAAQAAYEEMHRTGTSSRGAITAWREAIRKMGTDPELAYLARGMLRVFDEQGIFFGDVHGGNVGRCVRKHELRWVIIDPGHVSVVK